MKRRQLVGLLATELVDPVPAMAVTVPADGVRRPVTLGQVLCGPSIVRLADAVHGYVAGPVLALHQPCHGDELMPGPQCSHTRSAPARCPVCRERYPCPTAHALGVKA